MLVEENGCWPYSYMDLSLQLIFVQEEVNTLKSWFIPQQGSLPPHTGGNHSLGCRNLALSQTNEDWGKASKDWPLGDTWAFLAEI